MSSGIAVRRFSLQRGTQWLALGAMLVQFVASYGHLHPEDFRFLLRGHGATAMVSSAAPGGLPLDETAPDLVCSVCAAIHQLGSSALPEGAGLLAPSLYGAARAARLAALRLSLPPHLFFDTRGPPFA